MRLFKLSSLIMTLALVVSVASADSLRDKFNLTEETFAGGFKVELADSSVSAVIRPEKCGPAKGHRLLPARGCLPIPM